MRSVVVQHVPFEGPGLIGPALSSAGPVSLVRADLGDALPEASQLDVLVLMGGRWGRSTTSSTRTWRGSGR